MIDERDRNQLLEARRRVAAMKPGCANGILRDDPNTNWDRGRLVQDELAKLREAGWQPPK